MDRPSGARPTPETQTPGALGAMPWPPDPSEWGLAGGTGGAAAARAATGRGGAAARTGGAGAAAAAPAGAFLFLGQFFADGHALFGEGGFLAERAGDHVHVRAEEVVGVVAGVFGGDGGEAEVAFQVFLRGVLLGDERARAVEGGVDGGAVEGFGGEGGGVLGVELFQGFNRALNVLC